MIIRLWRGWTSPGNADAYQRLLDEAIVPGIIKRQIAGLHQVDIFRRHGSGGGEVEFVTIMTFEDWAAVEVFAGPGGTTSVVPAEARQLLSRFDTHSQHYDTVARHTASTFDQAQCL